MMRNSIVYAVKHKDEDIRARSRSGGIFTAISDIIIENGGAVYGCALNDSFLAVHERATTKQHRDKFRGSKYIQSDMGDCYKLIEKDLNNGIDVLFSGTPCQVHGVINYLKVKKVNTDRLITIDIICHGVPSPEVWSNFIKNKFDIKDIEKVDFRDKKNFGWRDHVETLTVNGEEISSRDFTTAFLSHLIVRQSCFYCHYKKTQRISDITIGDYWRIENNDKDFDDDKGVSIVLINTDNGEKFFNLCQDKLTVKTFPLATSLQPALDHNYIEPAKRQDFWKEYNGKNLTELIQKFTAPPPLPFYKKIISKCIETASKIFK